MLHFLFAVGLMDFHVAICLAETARKMIVDVNLLRPGDSYIGIHAQISFRNLNVLSLFETIHMVHDRLGLCGGLHAKRVGWHGEVRLVFAGGRRFRAKNSRGLF